MTIRVGLESTKVILTEVGQKWFMEAYPQGIVYEYDENEPFDLKAMGADFVDVICPLGIPYRLPTYIDGEITFKMADHKAKKRMLSDKCPMEYPCNIGDVECEECDNWITIQMISDRYPFGYAVQRCELDIKRVCPDTASSHLCIPNENAAACKTCRVPEEASDVTATYA